MGQGVLHRVSASPRQAAVEAIPGTPGELSLERGERSTESGEHAQFVSSSFDGLYVQRPRRWLLLLLGAYLVAATLFAVQTPPWQAPDEPAHYNFVRHIATNGQLPVLRLGDYNESELVRLRSSRFRTPAELGSVEAESQSQPQAGDSISSVSADLVAGLRYESYQPPLFYMTASPVYLLFRGSLLALRLYNVALGLGALFLLYLCLELVFPGKPLITLGATAFAALLPMHVAVNSSLNNDVLAELLVMASALVLLRWMRPYFYSGDRDVAFEHDRGHLLLLGALLGLGMVTKVYAYGVAPLFAAIVVWTIWRSGRSWRRLWFGVGRALWIISPAALIALPMWVRNLALYGGWDLLGTHWHDIVVTGQPRTDEWIATYGSLSYFERAFGLTFRSFWGVFGWMGVFMDERIYRAALFFSGVLFLGLLWASVRLISGEPDTDMDAFQTSVIAIFGLLLVVVALAYVWYNLKFVQHQGRYFFWGMLAIGTVVALAWRELLHPLQGAVTGIIAAVLGVSLLVANSIGQEVDKWSIVMVLALATFLLAQPVLLLGTISGSYWPGGRRLAPWAEQGIVPDVLEFLRFVAWLMPFVLLFLLDLLIPSLFILPQLAG